MSAPNVCEKCGKEYYSDTEYEQHLFMHQQYEFLEYAKQNAIDLGVMLTRISNQMHDDIFRICTFIEADTIARIALTKNIDYGAAVKEYMNLHDIWRATFDEKQKAKDKASQEGGSPK